MSLHRVAPGSAARSASPNHDEATTSVAAERSEDRATQRATLLRVRERIEEMLSAVPPSRPAAAVARGARDWMRICEFARTHHYSTKTVSQWCKLGMPHIGNGHYTRIDVREAEKWIADDGPTKAAMKKEIGRAHV